MTLARDEYRLPWLLEPTGAEERIDKIFRDMMRGWLTAPALAERLFEHPTLLRLEEYVEGDMCVIRAELPGIDPEKDVEVTVSDSLLHIKAQRSERTEEKGPERYRSEFRYGSFERHIRLPKGTSEADVKASYKDGILEVRVPMGRASEAAATKVAVERA